MVTEDRTPVGFAAAPRSLCFFRAAVGQLFAREPSAATEKTGNRGFITAPRTSIVPKRQEDIKHTEVRLCPICSRPSLRQLSGEAGVIMIACVDIFISSAVNKHWLRSVVVTTVAHVLLVYLRFFSLLLLPFLPRTHLAAFTHSD